MVLNQLKLYLWHMSDCASLLIMTFLNYLKINQSTGHLYIGENVNRHTLRCTNCRNCKEPTRRWAHAVACETHQCVLPRFQKYIRILYTLCTKWITSTQYLCLSVQGINSEGHVCDFGMNNEGYMHLQRSQQTCYKYHSQYFHHK